MVDSIVQVAPDSTGKKLQTFQNVVGANTVEAEAVVLVDSSGVLVDSRDASDRANRLLGIVYGNLAQLPQRPVSFDLYAALRYLGTEIDPRSIRALAKVTDEIYSVFRTDAGVAYDARQIRALTAADAVTASIAAAQTINVGTVTTLPAVTLADAENPVCPKAKGKTTLSGAVYVTNGSSTLRTVTAGKTFYLTGGSLQNVINATSIGAQAFLEFDVGGNGVFQPLLHLFNYTSALVDRFTVAVPLVLNVPLPLVAGSVLKVRSDNANMIAVGSYSGWEE